MSIQPTTEGHEPQLRQACAQLQRAIRSGAKERAEHFFQQFPPLADQPDLAVELIYCEFTAREELGQPGTVEEYLQRFPQWRRELEDQFQVHQFLREGTGPKAAPTSLGSYELLEELGRGGSAVVIRARHRDLQRLAAIKMILAGPFAGAEAAERFRAEAETIARLSHPNIVQIYEVGAHDGRPYLVLEYVAGGTLADHLQGQPQPSAASAELLETLARAVDHAHQQGIVHRDLKPANILLSAECGVRNAEWKTESPALRTPHSALRTPKIGDFGLARLLDGPKASGETGALVGTPSYMAPEQAAGDRVGPAADIYALGAILYELLTGRPPFRADTALATLAQVATVDPVPPQRLQPGVPRDLATICLKCLEKDPTRRYASAMELAKDLRRFQRGEPILARPTRPVERAWKWARRRPALAGLLGVSLVATLALLFGSLWANAQLSAAALQEARLKQDALDQLEITRQSLYAIQLAQVQDVYASDPGRALQLLEDEEACPPRLRDFAWGLFHQLASHDLRTLRAVGPEPAGEQIGVAFCPEGRQLVSAGGQRVQFWDVATGTAGTRFDLPSPVDALAGSASSRMLVFGGREGPLLAWDGKAAPRELASPPGIRALALSIDDKRIAVLTRERTLEVLTTEEGKPCFTIDLRPTTIAAATFLPDGQLAVACGDLTLRLFDREGKETQRTAIPGRPPLIALAASPDGTLLAVAGTNRNRLTLLRTSDLTVVRDLKDHLHQLASVAFSLDGKYLASGGRDREVRVWETATGVERQCFRGHTAMIRGLAFAPDGGTLASAAEDGTVKLWDLRPAPIAEPDTEPARKVIALAFSRDGKKLAIGRDDGTVYLHEPPTIDGRLSPRPKVIPCHGNGVLSLAFHPASNWLATGSDNGELRLWNTEKGSRIAALKGHTGRIRAVTFTSDGRWLASAGEEGAVRLWEVDTGQQVALLEGTAGPVRSVGFSPDGATLATGHDDGNAILWNLQRREEVARLPVSRKAVLISQFSPDGKTLVFGGLDYQVSLWDVAKRECRALLPGHTEFVFSAAFTPDGKTLATGSGNRFIDVPGEVRLWDVATGQRRATLAGQTGPVAFTQEGARLVTVDQFTTVRFWPGKENGRR